MKKLMALLMTLAALTASSAFAHTDLASTTPADRAELTAAPKEVVLEFSDAVRLTALTIQKDGASKQSLGPLPSAAAKSFTVAAPALGDGHYVVSWRALSGDSHIINGEFMFAIGTTPGHDAHGRGDHGAAHPATGDVAAHAGMPAAHAGMPAGHAAMQAGHEAMQAGMQARMQQGMHGAHAGPDAAAAAGAQADAQSETQVEAQPGDAQPVAQGDHAAHH